MSENTTPVTELTSQYVSQVSSDLERNVKEQDRITAEIAALQEQLTGLQHDHTVLVSMQQALGVAARSGAPAVAEGAVVPAPRKKTTDVIGAEPAPKKVTEQEPEAKKRSAKKPAAKPAAKPVVKKAVAKKPAAKKAAPQTAQPTLVELVRRHLAEQQEPRSAAEVSEALGKAHPEREIQTKVIRTTLENLVARNNAQRTKQGTSVFYTVPTASVEPTPAPAAAVEEETAPDAAK
ncbi:hypothetical protein A6P39_005770 [Streptomyces sp. FXJ1.172]|uniref:hypothetical protein n=1 Tax=Streptomyces sp. FXJ1.172 TaxID=710705 RepID=UPI0007D036A0|nr:hypothetical protein [Streptomyces sp. FXJ1.172]WEO93563.1 hypothetical protein A6P39_005770 [Streptomyces sp. FXJ1.172]